MRLIIILTFLLGSSVFAQNKTDSLKKMNKDTSIIGKTFNAKAGAIIISLDEQTYYIDGLTAWPAKKLGKIVKVKGVLSQKDYGSTGRNDKNEIVQGMEGKMSVITKATWFVLKK